MANLKPNSKINQDTIDFINLQRESHLSSQTKKPFNKDNDGVKTKPHKLEKLIKNLASDMGITHNAVSFYEFFDKDKKQWVRCHGYFMIISSNVPLRRNPTEEQIKKYGLKGFQK